MLHYFICTAGIPASGVRIIPSVPTPSQFPSGSVGSERKENIMQDKNVFAPNEQANSKTSALRIPGKFHACLAIVMIIGTTACGPVRDDRAEQVDSRAPSVSYDFNTDNGLLEANAKARAYCSQYAATPSMAGTIVDRNDGTRTVRFECISSSAVTAPMAVQAYPAPPAAPRGYLYRSDSELLAAIQSADSYCGQYGQNASTSIATNANGSRSLSFECRPR